MREACLQLPMRPKRNTIFRLKRLENVRVPCFVVDVINLLSINMKPFLPLLINLTELKHNELHFFFELSYFFPINILAREHTFKIVLMTSNINSFFFSEKYFSKYNKCLRLVKIASTRRYLLRFVMNPIKWSRTAKRSEMFNI